MSCQDVQGPVKVRYPVKDCDSQAVEDEAGALVPTVCHVRELKDVALAACGPMSSTSFDPDEWRQARESREPVTIGAYVLMLRGSSSSASQEPRRLAESECCKAMLH